MPMNKKKVMKADKPKRARQKGMISSRTGSGVKNSSCERNDQKENTAGGKKEKRPKMDKEDHWETEIWQWRDYVIEGIKRNLDELDDGKKKDKIKRGLVDMEALTDELEERFADMLDRLYIHTVRDYTEERQNEGRMKVIVDGLRNILLQLHPYIHEGQLP